MGINRRLPAAYVTAINNASTDADTLIVGLSKAEKCVEKSDGAMLNGADDLFTVTGGPVLATLVGIVTTEIGANAATGQLKITTTAPPGTTNLSTAVNIETDAVGTSYRFVGATGVLTPATAGAKIIDPVTVGDCWFLLPIGTVTFTGSAANTGNIKWYLRYKPLSPDSVVVAAA